MNDMELNHLDRRLIAELQLNPRASWAALASRFAVSPVTLARRWEKMTETGLAWITVAPDLSTGYGSLDMGMALVEVNVLAGHLSAVVEKLSLCPEIATLEITSGQRSLMLTVLAGSTEALAVFLLKTLESIQGITAVRSHPAPRTLVDASQWRITADEKPSRPLTHHFTRRTRDGRGILHAVARELAQEGRISAVKVAEHLDIHPRTAREAIAILMRSGKIRFRTEIARSHSGWPICAWYLIRSSPAQRVNIGKNLSRFREVRAIVETIGTTDLAVVVWMKSLAHIQELEIALETRMTMAEVVDRILVIRTVKLMGNILDEEGRRKGFVPLPSYL